MPRVNTTLPDTSQTITRPITQDIIRQLSKITKINPDTRIFFPGSSEVMHTNTGTIDGKDERFAIFKTNYINYVEIDEEYDADGITTTAVNNNEFEPIFQDDSLGISIRPIYSSTRLTIHFKYTCPSKTEALRWRDDMRIKVSQMRDINIHDLNYHYLLPNEYITLLKVMYDLREAKAPYGETFVEYVNAYSTSNMTLIGDLVGKNARISIAETQVRVLGIYDFDYIPEKPERDDSGVWVTSFSYKVRFDKPISCLLQYPIMVHNQLLPFAYTEHLIKWYDLEDETLKYRQSLKALNLFETSNLMGKAIDKVEYFRLPSIDDYVIIDKPSGTGTIWTALCEVDSLNLRTLLNLNELGELVMDADILQFIRDGEYTYMTNPYRSIFTVSLYRGDYLASSSNISIDSALNVISTSDLDLRKQYRLRFSIVADLTYLDGNAVNRLRGNPTVLLKVIKSINRTIRNDIDLSFLTKRQSISINDFSLIFALLTGRNYNEGVGNWESGGQDLPNSQYEMGGVSTIDDLIFNSSIYRYLSKSVLEDMRQNRIQTNNVLNTGIIVSI